MPKTPPFAIPFPLNRAGRQVETEIRIFEDRTYRFMLRFMFKTPEERKRVGDLVGVSDPVTYHDREGRLVRQTRGITIPVHLTVHAGEQALKDARYDTYGREGFTARYFSRQIEAVYLPEGLYRATVRTLNDIPELEGVETLFTAYSRYL